jgi:hypothetical protein
MLGLVKSKPKPSLRVKLTTADGRTFDFGTQKTGVLGPLSAWRQNRKIDRYIKVRLNDIENPDDRIWFMTQMERLKQTLKESN